MLSGKIFKKFRNVLYYFIILLHNKLDLLHILFIKYFLLCFKFLIKLLEYGMKVVERVLERRLRKVVEIDKM